MTRLLKLGSAGPDVAGLIDDLIALGFALPRAEVFTKGVKTCVEAFQAANLDSLGRPLRVDGAVGEHTAWAIAAARGRVTPASASSMLMPPPLPGGSAAGRAALQAALAEANAGRGEAGRDNDGPDVLKYLGGVVAAPANWCAGFVSWCFKTALGREPVFGYLVGAQAVHKRMATLHHAYAAKLSDPPQPGDIITWRRVDPARPAATAWQGHIGLVAGYADGYLHVVEGNKGPFPARVKVFQYPWTDLVASTSGDPFKGLFGLSRHP